MSDTPFLCCQCNTVSTSCVCGSFECPTVPDEGRGYPYRQKINCEAPTLPIAPCSDDYYETVYQPEKPNGPFTVLSRLYDQNCILITDQNGQPIWLVII